MPQTVQRAYCLPCKSCPHSCFCHLCHQKLLDFFFLIMELIGRSVNNLINNYIHNLDSKFCSRGWGPNPATCVWMQIPSKSVGNIEPTNCWIKVEKLEFA
ncbi:unnamed protein product [Caretta caretta]